MVRSTLTVLKVTTVFVSVCLRCEAGTCIQEDSYCLPEGDVLVQKATATSETFASADGLNLLQTKMSFARAQKSKDAHPSTTASSSAMTDVTAHFSESSSVHATRSKGNVNVRLLEPVLPMNNNNFYYSEVARTTWQKTLRCAGPSEASCQECVSDSTSNIDCFGACPIIPNDNIYKQQDDSGMCVTSSGGKWVRFVFKVHLKCPVDAILNWNAKQVTGGTMKLLWDGNPLFSINERAPKSDMNKHSEVPAGKEGGHTLTIEFTSTRGTGSSLSAAHFNWLSLMMKEPFVSCLDSKGCLDELKKNGKPGMRLRNSNALLFLCLDNVYSLPSELQNPCWDWRGCMFKAGSYTWDHMWRVYHLLVASGSRQGHTAAADLQVATALHESTSSLVVGNSDDAGDANCLYPPNEDPLEWDCDCYDQILGRCRAIRYNTDYYLFQSCLQAHFCLYGETCQDWKNMYCHEQGVQTAIQRLRWQFGASLVQQESPQLGTALMDRAKGNTEEKISDLGSELDRSLGAKKCD
eukprot:gnl/TRDRNA2_/TRDRNA2_80104_c0_seq1.p1 gnl/TRDRNA2_/TRDRNA2_80104_c0~~gnl/TRDRNA2_/TRDRNA2_80104_c0_seq1.p1  ORF type:complete len:522 (-),score=49.26 gnl/TRDRNA2_/TRDRNA2_80104_c0_seq1:150-1715(-)